ncbi:hypothetical protein Ddc_15497 [Ditylenchus destructor]|nr:hypothetical protein Ddc_15497 [Ditylenchus destructor]
MSKISSIVWILAIVSLALICSYNAELFFDGMGNVGPSLSILPPGAVPQTKAFNNFGNFDGYSNFLQFSSNSDILCDDELFFDGLGVSVLFPGSAVICLCSWSRTLALLKAVCSHLPAANGSLRSLLQRPSSGLYATLDASQRQPNFCRAFHENADNNDIRQVYRSPGLITRMWRRYSGKQAKIDDESYVPTYHVLHVSGIPEKYNKLLAVRGFFGKYGLIWRCLPKIDHDGEKILMVQYIFSKDAKKAANSHLVYNGHLLKVKRVQVMLDGRRDGFALPFKGQSTHFQFG